ncbi:MAG: hypothetical protein ABEH88_11955 [Halobacteriales archaeon]
MSASTERSGGSRSLDLPPEFELESTYDDPDDPEMVTVHPSDSENPTTEWLTIDAGFVLAIGETV